MTPIHKKPYGTNLGEFLQIGWASWNAKGQYKEKSVKYVYPDKSGVKISRGCPEIPFHILVDMLEYVAQQNNFSNVEIQKIKTIAQSL